MLWGGLRPIRSRFLLDVLTLVGFIYSTVTPIDRINSCILVLACLLTLITAGLTNRWTITFPMVPIVVLQLLRRVVPYLSLSSETKVSSKSLIFLIAILPKLITILSIICIALSAILSVLFPAVEIPPPITDAPFHVGVIDLHLPVRDFEANFQSFVTEPSRSSTSGGIDNKRNSKRCTGMEETNDNEGYVTARLLYPTNEDPSKSSPVPYLDPRTADSVCTALMKIGAPPPLNDLYWMLRNWKLSYIHAVKNAKPILSFSSAKNGKEENAEKEESKENKNDAGKQEDKLDLVVFSHGITGNSPIYSYQTMNLAAHGNLVLVIEHSDGSAIGVERQDGSFMPFNTSIGELLTQHKKSEEHIRARRRQADYRAMELLAVLDALLDLNNKNLIALENLGISFVNRLNVDGVTLSGHSFGAVTALAAASLKPNLVDCVIAHDPAFDWAPDYCRRAFLSDKKFKNSRLSYTGGTSGYENEVHEMEEEKKSESFAVEDEEIQRQSRNEEKFNNLDMLFLYSHEFQSQNWGEYEKIKDLQNRGQLSAISDVGFVYDSKHSAFSDSCMKTPLWLARSIGHTGKRNPIEVAEEIASRTIIFLRNVKEIGKDSQKDE